VQDAAKSNERESPKLKKTTKHHKLNTTSKLVSSSDVATRI